MMMMMITIVIMMMMIAIVLMIMKVVMISRARIALYACRDGHLRPPKQNSSSPKSRSDSVTVHDPLTNFAVWSHMTQPAHLT